MARYSTLLESSQPTHSFPHIKIEWGSFPPVSIYPIYLKMSSSTTSVPRGDFSSLTLGDWDREMIESGFKAVDSVEGGWEFLRTYDPGHGGFMFSSPPPKMEEINDAVNKFYGGHSGASYGGTMRNLEFIAKKGWDAFVQRVGVKPVPAAATVANPTLSVGSVLDHIATVDRFINTLPANSDLRTFANAIQNDAGMRARIPDIDAQADALREFANGQMSYAEMRSRCG